MRAIMGKALSFRRGKLETAQSKPGTQNSREINGGVKMEEIQDQVKKKRGDPKGNQNARKHGFYSRVLDEAERLD